MTSKSVLATAFLAALIAFQVGAAATGPATAADSAGDQVVEVVSAQTQINAVVGQRFTYESQILNSGRQPTEPILAHVNVASLTSDVYVDPEDWSSSRSVVLAPLAAGGRRSLSWEVQAVSPGSFALYVVLVPVATAGSGTARLAVSPSVHVSVASRQTLSAGGALPVVIVVPILLGIGVVASRFRARRATR